MSSCPIRRGCDDGGRFTPLQSGLAIAAGVNCPVLLLAIYWKGLATRAAKDRAAFAAQAAQSR